MALAALNRHQDALASYGRALALQPDNADVHFNAALSLLTIGDYPRGLAEYEWRWKRAGMGPRKDLRRPLWLGETPLAGKTILLHAEQGLGDTMMFARYVPLLARAGAQVVLEVQPELKALAGRARRRRRDCRAGEPLPPFDLHCPLTSLPFACKTELSNVPADIPYLRASEAQTREMAAAPRTACRRRVSRWPGPAAPPMSTTATARSRCRSLSRCLRRKTCALSASSASFVRPTPSCWRAIRASLISAASLPTSPTPPRCWRSSIS